jgi:hypothetical protein
MAIRRMATIWYDDESGELKRIDYAPAFQDASDLLQADVLLDVFAALKEVATTAQQAAMANFARQRTSRDATH